MPEDVRCPGCGTHGLELIYEVEDVPVHSVLLLETRQAARDYPRGDIRLGYCRKCGLITNMAFDPEVHEYSPQYEETQGFSPTFSAFHRELAGNLIDRFDLHRKTILEIGCGKGEFLLLLCEMGRNQGIGFDPAYVQGRLESEALARIQFINDFYSEKYADMQADFVCCKMTLEHIQPVSDFVRMVRRAIGDRHETVVFFQVPETQRILREIAFWDIYYEHCSYFSPSSLANVFQAAGFAVRNVWRDYGDQYLMIAARPGAGTSEPLPNPDDDFQDLNGAVDFFSRSWRQRLASWKSRLEEYVGNRQRVALWGGGSKAVAFLTTLGIKDEIGFAVDINPYRHHTFLAGTGHEILPPAELRSYRPDVVIIMNEIYVPEIQRDLQALGLSPVLIPLK